MTDVEKTTADRLILISDVDWLHLEPPVLVKAGERYWVDWDQMILSVQDEDGVLRAFPHVHRPDGRR